MVLVGYQVCSYCNSLLLILMCLRPLSFTYFLNSPLALGSPHLDNQSGILLRTPGICLAFSTNWCVADMSAISLGASCNSESLLLPEFSTEATASFSTCIQKYLPSNCLAHILRPTITASISSTAMFLPW